MIYFVLVLAFILFFILFVFFYLFFYHDVKVFAEFEPNMPRVAGRAEVKLIKKDFSRSASAVGFKAGRAKVKNKKKNEMKRRRHRWMRQFVFLFVARQYFVLSCFFFLN